MTTKTDVLSWNSEAPVFVKVYMVYKMILEMTVYDDDYEKITMIVTSMVTMRTIA